MSAKCMYESLLNKNVIFVYLQYIPIVCNDGPILKRLSQGTEGIKLLST